MKSLRYWKIDYSAVHDGPGIRTAIFFKGCPLRCIWCANPEGQQNEDSLLYHFNRCKNCHVCIDTCPHRAITLADGSGEISIDRAVCTTCGICVPNCKNKAIEVIGKSIDIDELMSELERNRQLYRKTGGGVTFTGGEPLSQREPLVELVRRCRLAGIHSVLETCGCAEDKLFYAAAVELDWIYFDIKCIDPDKHIKLTGVSNHIILQNLKMASDIMKTRGKTLVVRIVVVPGVTDGENLELAAVVLSRLPFISGVELLRYHNFGEQKYSQLSRSPSLDDVPLATQDDLLQGKKIFSEAGLKVL